MWHAGVSDDGEEGEIQEEGEAMVVGEVEGTKPEVAEEGEGAAAGVGAGNEGAAAEAARPHRHCPPRHPTRYELSSLSSKINCTL